MPVTFYTNEEVEAIRLDAMKLAKSYHNLVGLANQFYDLLPVLDQNDTATLKSKKSDLDKMIHDFEAEWKVVSGFDSRAVTALDQYEPNKSLTAVSIITARIRLKLDKH